jgi:hypothetical protein
VPPPPRPGHAGCLRQGGPPPPAGTRLTTARPAAPPARTPPASATPPPMHTHITPAHPPARPCGPGSRAVRVNRGTGGCTPWCTTTPLARRCCSTALRGRSAWAAARPRCAPGRRWAGRRWGPWVRPGGAPEPAVARQPGPCLRVCGLQGPKCIAKAPRRPPPARRPGPGARRGPPASDAGLQPTPPPSAQDELITPPLPIAWSMWWMGYGPTDRVQHTLEVGRGRGEVDRRRPSRDQDPGVRPRPSTFPLAHASAAVDARAPVSRLCAACARPCRCSPSTSRACWQQRRLARRAPCWRGRPTGRCAPTASRPTGAIEMGGGCSAFRRRARLQPTQSQACCSKRPSPSLEQPRPGLRTKPPLISSAALRPIPSRPTLPHPNPSRPTLHHQPRT